MQFRFHVRDFICAVFISINIRSQVPVRDKSMIFSFNLLRHNWHD